MKKGKVQRTKKTSKSTLSSLEKEAKELVESQPQFKSLEEEMQELFGSDLKDLDEEHEKLMQKMQQKAKDLEVTRGVEDLMVYDFIDESEDVGQRESVHQIQDDRNDPWLIMSPELENHIRIMHKRHAINVSGSPTFSYVPPISTFLTYQLPKPVT